MYRPKALRPSPLLHHDTGQPEEEEDDSHLTFDQIAAKTVDFLSSDSGHAEGGGGMDEYGVVGAWKESEDMDWVEQYATDPVQGPSVGYRDQGRHYDDYQQQDDYPQVQPQPPMQEFDYPPPKPKPNSFFKTPLLQSKEKGKGKMIKIDVDEEEDDYFGGVDDAAFEMELSNSADLFSGNLAKPRLRNQPPKPTSSRIPPRQTQPSQQQQQQQQQQRSNQVPSGPRQAKLIPISILPDMYRSLFRSYGVFNAVQSTCFHSVYKTDENVVISAPTGSGKTVLFELAILRLLTSPTSPSDSKCVYLAPTKSLCSERYKDWKQKFGKMGLGWDIVELTGDSMAASLRDVGNCRIIVTTPEKWDAMTRRWYSYEKILARVRLFCIDECHFVGLDTRGAVLEVVVSRTKMLGTDTRFIALSATAPNIEDVGLWIGKSKVASDDDMMEDGEGGDSARVFSFSEDFRPVKLQKIVMGYPKRDQNDFVFNNNLNHKLYDLIVRHSSGKPVLIFCSTRKGTTQAAEVLAKQYKEALQKNPSNVPWPKPGRIAVSPLDKNLGALVEKGIAFHHAGLDNQDRRFVEEGFTNGSISIVCATSTLSVGVNLPARMVIIKGTVSWGDGRFVETSDSEILQMLGRAGRPQFDTMGVACIMTDSDKQRKYEALAKSETSLESCLHKNLIEHINSEISLRTITDIPSAIHWLRSTFLFVRINKDPKYYALTDGVTSPDQGLESFCVEAIRELVKSGIVEQHGDTLGPTELGDMMSKYYLQHSTFLALQAMPLRSTMRVMLETVAACDELASVRFRAGEKSLYAKQNKNIRYPCAKLATTADKVNILIQSTLTGTPLADLKADSSNPVQDAALIWKDIPRIVKCMVDLCLERRDGSVKHALELLRSINAKAWDNSPVILRQLDGIGEKSVKVLTEKNIRTFSDLLEADAADIGCYLNRNPALVHKLRQQAQKFPRFTVDVSSDSEEATPTGVKVTLSVTLGVESKPPPMLKKNGTRLYASCLINTSDGEFVDYRRITVDALLSAEKSFHIAVILPRPSQRIYVMVSSDDIAGSEVKATYTPSSAAAAYPLPLIRGSTPEPEVIVENPQEPSVQLQRRKTVTKLQVQGPAVEKAPTKLANGKFACNHACGDKTKCRHLCCREGLEAPPKKSKAQIAKQIKPPAQAPKQRAPIARLKSPASSPDSSLPGRPRPLSIRRDSAIRPKQEKGRDLMTWLDDSDEELPTVSELIAGSSTNKKKGKQVAGKRAPPTPQPDANEEIDELASPAPSPASKRSPPSPDPVQVKRVKINDGTPETALFRPRSPRSTSRSPTLPPPTTVAEPPSSSHDLPQDFEQPPVVAKEDENITNEPPPSSFDEWLEANLIVL